MTVTREELKIAISNCDKEIELNKSKRAILVKQETEMLERDRAAALPALLAKIEELGLKASDLGLTKSKKNKTSSPSTTNVKKYRDPDTGAGWSGRGSRPSWIKDKDKNLFLNPLWPDKSDVAVETNSFAIDTGGGTQLTTTEMSSPNIDVSGFPNVTTIYSPAQACANVSELDVNSVVNAL